MATSFVNVRLFDGMKVHSSTTVTISGTTISSVGAPPPPHAAIIDGTGMTLLPGLIDAHVHTSHESLGVALRFGVTTELEMAGFWTPEKRAAVATDDTVADLRSADFAMTAPGGHPNQILEKMPEHMRPGAEARREIGHSQHDHQHPQPSFKPPSVSSADEAVSFVATRVAAGADYIKFMIEDGAVLGAPGLPVLNHEALKAGVAAAHSHGKLAIAHAMTLAATTQALSVGVDGLAHLFLDGPITPQIVEQFRETGAFVTACACLNASCMNIRPEKLLSDDRVTSRLPQIWIDTLGGTSNCFPHGAFENVLDSIKALHDAGIDVLVGTDAAVPVPEVGGLSHGASVHHELQLFAHAGLTPIEALKAATSVTARRFGLDDRGQIRQGLRADLLLVKGDPTTNISDTLNIVNIWRRGSILESKA